jgi:PAS domain S-box-containing protein
MTLQNIDPSILEFFVQLINETHDIFLVVDEEWNVLFANKKARDYFDNNNLQGKNFIKQFPSFNGTELHKNINSVIASGRPSEFEHLSPVSKRWMYYRVYSIAQKVAIYATDINLRKEAQRTIQQNQERYFNFISQSSEGIWRYELEEPIPIELPADQQIEMVYQHAYLAECNDAMAKMYGFHDAYDLMGSKLELLLPKNEENLAYLRAFIDSGYKLYDAESKELAKDGSIRYMLNNLIGIVEKGHVTRAWGTQRDITRIKEVENQLKDAQTQLNLALAAGSAGTFIWNIKTNEVQWTKEEEALYGLPEGAFGGSLDGWSKAVHPEDLPAAMKALEKCIQDKTDLDTEFRIIWPDKSVHWILAKGRVLYDENGTPEKMIGVNVDITGRKTHRG